MSSLLLCLELSSTKPLLLAGLFTADEMEDNDNVEEKRLFCDVLVPFAFDFSTAALNVSSTAMRLATASS